MKLEKTLFDKIFIERSFEWLMDDEISLLTMTPKFTKEQQKIFFESIPNRSDYYIFGILCDDNPIGSFGLKNVGDNSAEYWGYIGEKLYWGKKIGSWMILEMERFAKTLGLGKLVLRVSQENTRAIGLYVKNGFSEYSRNNEIILMSKEI